METLTQTDNKAMCEEILEILSSQFGIEKPKLIWVTTPTRGASASYYTNSITSGETRRWSTKFHADVMLHEFAHILNYKRNIEPVPYNDRYVFPQRESFNEYGNPKYGRDKVRPHGIEYMNILLEVAKVWYGDESKYPWAKEYRSIVKWYLKRKSN